MDQAKLTCLLSLVFYLTVAGCESAPSHDDSARGVKVTTRPSDVSGCRAVSNLNGLPSMPQFGDAIEDLRSQAVGAGGNVVFIESDKPPCRGTTYRCDSGYMPK